MKKMYLSLSAILLIATATMAQTWSTNGSNLYSNPTTANVGIGTTTPQYKLDVAGTMQAEKLLINKPTTINNWNNLWQSGFYDSDNAANAPEPTGWFWGINMNHSSNGPTYRYGGQIAVRNSNTAPTMYFRSTNANGEGTWAKVLTSAESFLSVEQSNAEGGFIDIRNHSKTQNGTANSWRILNMAGVYGNSLQFWAYDNIGCGNGGLCASRLTLMDNGNVGIGTMNPQYKLDVKGRVYIDSGESIGGWNYNYLHWNSHSLVMGTPVGYYAHNSIDLKPGGVTQEPLFSQIRMYTSTAPNQQTLNIQINSNENTYFNNPGNFGIGTNNPQYKLDVKGEIRATKVRVEAINNFPDYVFAEDYNLRSLNDVKSHIDTYGHLPEIPTAAEVEENGIELVEMQSMLLKKIEELTLYIIEQDRRINELETQNR